jgi:acyl-CoA thioester hydrolase
MEICRTKLLEHIGLSIKDLEKRDISPILVSTEINYKIPLYIYDEVKIEIWISKLMNASAEMSFNFFNGKGELAATGKQKGLFITLSTRKPYRIKPDERAAFEKLLIE